MDEIVIEFNQFEVENGSNCCMAASMCFARLFLDQDIHRQDLERIIHAGAALYGRWLEKRDTYHQQYWTCVTRDFPAFLSNISCSFETNGFFDSNGTECTSSFDAVMCQLASGGVRRGGVLTCEHSSYSICFDGNYYYLFDPHGQRGGGAYMRRTKDVEIMKSFITSELVLSHRSQFSCVLFEAGSHNTDVVS